MSFYNGPESWVAPESLPCQCPPIVILSHFPGGESFILHTTVASQSLPVFYLLNSRRLQGPVKPVATSTTKSYLGVCFQWLLLEWNTLEGCWEIESDTERGIQEIHREGLWETNPLRDEGSGAEYNIQNQE